MMVHTYQNDHSVRWPLIRKLLSFGLSDDEVARLINWSAATVRADIIKHGSTRKLFPGRPKQSERYPVIFKRFIKLMFMNRKKELLEKEYQALRTWLEIDTAVAAYLHGLVRMAEITSWPHVTSEQEPYLQLMVRVWEYNPQDIDGTRSDEKAKKIFDLLCQKIVQKEQALPSSAIELQKQLLVYAYQVLDVDNQLCLAWPSNAQLVIEQALKKLSPRQAQVIRWRFGIGSEGTLTLEKVGQKLFLTKERIRQIETKALDKMRQLAKRSPLCFLSGMLNFKQVLDLEQRTIAITLREGRLLTEIDELKQALNDSPTEDEPELVNDVSDNALVEILIESVEVLNLSIRPTSCFHNDGISYLFELVGRPEHEILRIKNLGHKSLSEINQALAEFSKTRGVNIYVGMKLQAGLINGLYLSKFITEHLPLPFEDHWCKRTGPSDGVFNKRQSELLGAVGISHWSHLLPLSKDELLDKVPEFTAQDMQDVQSVLNACKSEYHLQDLHMHLGMEIPDWTKNLL